MTEEQLRKKMEYNRKRWAARTPEQRAVDRKKAVKRHAAMTPEQRAAASKQATEYNRLKHTGVTPAQYDQMFKEQQGLCANCSRPEWKIWRGKVASLSADHDHKTGKARRLLCYRCNHVLGLVDDDVAVLENMIGYLKRHSPQPKPSWQS